MRGNLFELRNYHSVIAAHNNDGMMLKDKGPHWLQELWYRRFSPTPTFHG